MFSAYLNGQYWSHCRYKWHLQWFIRKKCTRRDILAYIILSGLIIGPFILQIFIPPTLPFRDELPLSLILISGLLVGFGSHLGSGCTSGHGVCGVGRLSIRSIAATCLFMLTGAITIYIVRHILGA